MKIKVLYIHLLGVSILAIALASDVLTALDDLEFEGSNNRRILHNTDEARAENRTKRLRQATIEKATTAAPDDDDDKKTLAQQVADGKYGLIQKELFASPAKRPGIISYEVNPEVPKDNVNNLGGLQAEEIWLAENHLLVLKGGIYGENDQNGKAVWPPIDNYIAPQRQVKIPPNPKVPPPFPIQLKDGGPIEFVKGANGTGGPVLPFFDPRFGPPNFFPLPPFPGPGDNRSTHGNPGNFTQGNGFSPPFPLPPLPGSGLFPPAVAFLPPPGNLTELDEDDPSIYYPPPYDFVYHKDNSSFVPPGPLVPGIVLPPPPNFFAPYENKTKSAAMKQLPSRKPTKIKSRPPQYVQEARKTTRPTKPPKHTVTVSIITPKTTTTLAPIIISTTDGSQNEIVPPRTLPSDTPVGEWVPIPAPRPFYITELKNIRVGNKMRHYTPTTQWNFRNNTDVLQNDDYVRGYDYTPPQKKGRKYSTTVAPLRGFKPIYVPPSVISTTTIKPSTVVYTSTFNSIKTPENYYFYGDPNLNSNYPYRQRPLNAYYDYGDKNVNEVNTVAPAELYNEVSVKSPAEIGNIDQSHFDFYRQQFEPSTTTSSPINFYYFDKHNNNPQGPNFNLHLGEVNLQNTKESKSHRTNSKHLNPSMRTTTEKPPIFEYSYSAPGYGTLESPKVGANFATTPKPGSFDINFPIEKDQQYAYLDYQTPQKSNFYRHESTPTPQYYSTSKPSYGDVDGYGREVYKAKPTYTPRAKEQNIQLEDVTQKYFSIFGQKLNEDDLREPTTPAPSNPERDYYNYRNKGFSRPKDPNKHVKFPSDDYYDAPSEQPYYALPQKPVYRQPGTPSRHQNNYQQQDAYPNYYRFSSPQYDPYANYDEEELVTPGHSLHSDINVNLKRPPPPLEPDAELIDPAYVRPRGNAFISYQLPGSGGHFYFLTPQTVKAPYSPQAYPEFTGYYKRNVQSSPRRPRNPRKP
uniref:Uncharacterized protein n=1 Tax=Lygus hesperus TaxID=30085 RepID=A0A146LIF4_LYGHE